jgi:hypothetical protein
MKNPFTFLRKRESAKIITPANTVNSYLNLTSITDALKIPIIRTNLDYLANMLDVDYFITTDYLNKYLSKLRVDTNKIIYYLLSYGFSILQLLPESNEIKAIPLEYVTMFDGNSFMFDGKTYKIDNENIFLIYLGYFPSIENSILYTLITPQTFTYLNQQYTFSILTLYKMLLYSIVINSVKSSSKKNILVFENLTPDLIEAYKNLRIDQDTFITNSLKDVKTSSSSESMDLETLKYLTDLISSTTLSNFTKLLMSDDMTKANASVKHIIVKDFIEHYRIIIKDKIKEIFAIYLKSKGLTSDFEIEEKEYMQYDYIALYEKGIITLEEVRKFIGIDQNIV